MGKKVNHSLTHKQRELILAMKEAGCPEFSGITKEQASDYISKNYGLFRFKQFGEK